MVLLKLLISATAAIPSHLGNICAFRLSQPVPSFYQPHLARAFDTGEPMKSVFILTHFARAFAPSAKLVQLLKEPDFRMVPRLFLASHTWPIESATVLQQSSRVEVSEGGEFDSKVNADVVHLGGGYPHGKLCFSWVLSSGQKSTNSLFTIGTRTIKRFDCPFVIDGTSLAFECNGLSVSRAH